MKGADIILKLALTLLSCVIDSHNTEQGRALLVDEGEFWVHIEGLKSLFVLIK
ncbi:MAG: hypothetical protein JNL72_04930 [Flavipsychrobacter sp.]|nr:hypothetical protein [Flavipsychrobacter sp.]